MYLAQCGEIAGANLLGSVLVTKACTQQLQQHCEMSTAMHAQQALTHAQQVVACATLHGLKSLCEACSKKGTHRLRSGRCNEHWSSMIDKQSDVHYHDSLLISCSDSRLRAGDDSSRLRSQLWVSSRKQGCPLPACRNSRCGIQSSSLMLKTPVPA